MPFALSRSSRRRRPRRVLIGLAVLSLGCLSVLPADAATPSSGTVTDTASSVTWGGGPFVAPNVSGTTGTVSCDPQQACDDYALRVTVPGGYDAGHSLRVEIKWGDPVADFDLYALDAGGRQIAAAASTSDPDVLLLYEPSASLDPRQRERLWEFIGGLADCGTAVAFSTKLMHDSCRHPDAAEGVHSYLERRPPRFAPLDPA